MAVDFPLLKVLNHFRDNLPIENAEDVAYKPPFLFHVERNLRKTSPEVWLDYVVLGIFLFCSLWSIYFIFILVSLK